jgi:hypothetical protein
VVQFKYLETTLTNRNYEQIELTEYLLSVKNLLYYGWLSIIIDIKVYRIIILPVLHGSVTLGGEHRLGVFENRVLKKISGPKRDEVTGEWRRLRINKLHDM